MSKYIDLLREHNQEPEKKKKKSKKKGKSTAENPYRHQDESDKALLDDMAALLDEQESESVSTMDDYDENQDALIAEESIPEPNKAHQPSQSHSQFGFDVSEWLSHIEQTLSSMFNAIQNHESINISVLNEQLDTLFDQMNTNSNILDNLSLHAVQHASVEKGFNHEDLIRQSILKMVCALKIGVHIGTKFDTLQTYAVAAMLHNIGFVSIPESLRSIATLSKDNLQQAKQFALDYMASQDVQHEQLEFAIREADERFDGSGSQGLEKQDIAWVARLVALLSAYESRIQSTHQPLLPRDAIRELVKAHRKDFDPQIIKHLIDATSLYPVGTFVQLNTGEVGQVVNVHANSPLRPIVYITMDNLGETIPERKIDLKKQPNLMVKKSLFESSLKDLAAG